MDTMLVDDMRFCAKCGCETERNKYGKCKPCRRQISAKYVANNKEKRKETIAKYRELNREKEKEYQRIRYATKKDQVLAASAAWKERNKDRVKATNLAYYIANKHKWTLQAATRRARKIKQGGRLSPDIAEKLFHLQIGKCACGCKRRLGDDYHLDHIMPLALGGTNTDDNIQLLRAKCNRQKQAKHPVDFMQQRGFLL